jgi:hypothetical protein
VCAQVVIVLIGFSSFVGLSIVISVLRHGIRRERLWRDGRVCDLGWGRNIFRHFLETHE